MSNDTPIPAGFAPRAGRSAYMDLIGPVFERRVGERLALGLRIEAKHANTRGMCHGGVLASLADISLGYAMAVRRGQRGSMVTASLTIDFAGSARVGDWIESDVDIQKMGARLAFANCYLVCRDQRIVRASAIFADAKKNA